MMQACTRVFRSALSRPLLHQQRVGSLRLASVMGARFQSTIDKGGAEFGAWLENENSRSTAMSGAASRAFHCSHSLSEHKEVAEAVNEVFDKVDAEVNQEVDCGTFTAANDLAMDVDMKNMLRNNRKWVADTKARDPAFFERLGAGQAPKYLWIGCSDSRVPANQIMGLHPGDVFVHRNIANLVVGSDINMLSVLQYSVQVLKVQHILVTGHYGCGGVQAAMNNKDLGLIDNWLRHIRDVYRLHHAELNAITDQDLRFRRLVELNTMEQCLNLFKTGIVQKQRLETFQTKAPGEYATPRIHGLVFDPADGILRKLKVDFKKTVSQFRDIYDLYDVDDPAAEM